MSEEEVSRVEAEDAQEEEELRVYVVQALKERRGVFI